MKRLVVSLGSLFFAAAAIARGGQPATVPAADKPFIQTIAGSDVSFEMIPIPAGKFVMGSPEGEKGRRAEEGPQFEVRVDRFWMGKYVVTWPQYSNFLSNYSRVAVAMQVRVPRDQWADAVTYPTPAYELATGPILDRMGRGAGYPAVGMSHYAARQYTKWLSKKSGRFYRLPTEAEWEYACRAGSTTAYNFGDNAADLARHAWYVDNSNLKDGDPAYRKVGQFPANAWGLFDMHGNVAQWCGDQYDPAWYGKFAGKSVNWHDCINWPARRYPMCLRGGSYEAESADCRSAARLHSTRGFNNDDVDLPPSAHWEASEFWVGIRVVCPETEPDEKEKQKFWDAPDIQTQKALEMDRQLREVIPSPEKK